MKKLLLLSVISLSASEKKNPHLTVPPKIKVQVEPAQMPAEKKNYHLKAPAKITTTPYSSMPPQSTSSAIIKKTRVTVRLPDGTIIVTEEVQKVKST